MSKGNGTRTVKGGNFWLELKEILQEGIKNQWLAFRRNIAINLVTTVIFFMLIFIIASIIGKIVFKVENWLIITVMSSVLGAIPLLFTGTIIVKIVYKIESMLILIELLLIFILGVLLNHSIDNIIPLIVFNLYLLISLVSNKLVAESEGK